MTENNAQQQQLPNQTLTRVVPCTLDRSGKLVPITFTEGRLPATAELTVLPPVQVESMPYVPVPAHLFALNAQVLESVLNDSGTFKIALSYVSIGGGTYSADTVAVASTGNVDVTLLAANPNALIFIT